MNPSSGENDFYKVSKNKKYLSLQVKECKAFVISIFIWLCNYLSIL